MLPFEPVTLIWKVPKAAKVQDDVVLPDPVTLCGETLHEVLLLDRLTVPVKPFRGVIVMVEVPAEPALTVSVVGLATMAKSGIAV